MKTKTIYTIYFILLTLSAFSQPITYSNWAIGNGGGLKFQNGSLTQFSSQMACQDI